MAGNSVNGSGNEARPGAQILTLLAAPLTGPILKSLIDEPKRLTSLRQEVDFPAITTLRGQLRRLVEVGAVEKRRGDRFPGALTYALTEPGSGLRSVSRVLERWLDHAPDGSLPAAGNAARAAVKALTEAWSTRMLRALAAGPLTLTELDHLIGSLSYPSLERRLAAMRLAGLAVARPGDGRGTPYELTAWARTAVAPLAVAANWERHHLPGDAIPITAPDAEAAFLLAAPLLHVDARQTGTCRLAVAFPRGRRRQLAGATIAVQAGEVVSCTAALREDANAWAVGSAEAWLEALFDARTERLKLGGRRRLALDLVAGFRRAQSGVSL